MIFSEIVEEASDALLRSGSHVPTLLIAIEGIATPVRRTLRSFPATSEQREHVLYLDGQRVGEQYRFRKVQRVWFISEAWMSGSPDVLRNGMLPSQDPKRREVLLVLELDVSSPGLKQRIDIREMRRNAKRKLKALLTVSWLAEDVAETPLTPYGILGLAFLEGYAQKGEADFLKRVQTKMLQERMRMVGVRMDHVA